MKIRKKIDSSLSKLKDVSKGNNLDEIKSSTDELNSTWNEISSKMYQQAKTETETNSNDKNTSEKSSKSNEQEIEDADFEVVDEK